MVPAAGIEPATFWCSRRESNSLSPGYKSGASPAMLLELNQIWHPVNHNLFIQIVILASAVLYHLSYTGIKLVRVGNSEIPASGFQNQHSASELHPVNYSIYIYRFSINVHNYFWMPP